MYLQIRNFLSKMNTLVMQSDILRTVLLASVLSLTGCATYYFPANRLETPEAAGPGRLGHVEALAFQGGNDLLARATQAGADPETGKVPTPALQPTLINPVFGFSYALSPRLDLGVRFQPFAPLLFRAKYQLSGEPEAGAHQGNFSTALSGAAGLMLTAASGTMVTQYYLDVAFLAGYRLWEHHLFALAPYFAFGGLSGYSTGSSGTGMQYGGGLTYQYDVESVFLRLEESRNFGAYNSKDLGGYFTGVMFGFRI